MMCDVALKCIAPVNGLPTLAGMHDSRRYIRNHAGPFI